jgi:hypothetical protein
MTTGTIKLTAFLAGSAVAAAVHFGFYDPVRQSPNSLRPAMIIFDGIMIFLGTNILVFGYNLLRALLSVRGSKDEEEIERVVGPALQGDIADERLMRYTTIPFFAGLGVFIAGILIAFFKWRTAP